MRPMKSDSIWKFDPTGTDVVLDGPSGKAFSFHLMLHPKLSDARDCTGDHIFSR